MNFQKHIANAINNTAKTRERERESNSALNLSSSKKANCRTKPKQSIPSLRADLKNPRGNPHTANCHTEGVARSIQKAIDCHDSTLRAESRNDGVIFPSLAEGARGWVSLDSTAVIVGNDKENSVIASEQRERGNLSYNTKKVDCHDSTLRAESCNDKNNGLPRVASNARNDGNICHTERSEVSLKNIDCHAKSNDFARNDKNAKTTPKKRLALSLATSAILASLSIDSVAAACSWADDWSRGDANSHGIGYYSKVDCTGYTTADGVSSSARSVLNGGGYYQNTRLNLYGSSGSGTATLSFNGDTSKNNGKFSRASTTRELRFLGFQGSQTDFNISNSTTNPAGSVGIYFSGGARVNTITISQGNINTLDINGGSLLNSATVSAGATLGSLTIQGGSRLNSKLTSQGTIDTMTLGERNQAL